MNDAKSEWSGEGELGDGKAQDEEREGRRSIKILIMPLPPLLILVQKS